MQAIRIGNTKDIEKHHIKANRIVALYEVHEHTVCVRSHALQRFHERSNPERSVHKRPSRTKVQNYLEQIHSLLVSSELAKRRLRVGWIKGHQNQKISYRFSKGWIFVLAWDFGFGVWILKTAFPKATAEKKAYKIVPLKEHERPCSWDPFHNVMQEA